MTKKNPVTLDCRNAPDGKELPVAAEVLPSELLMLPLSGRPFSPSQTMPLVVDVDPWGDTIERIGESPHYIAGLVMTKRATDEIPRREDFHSIGCAIRVHHPMHNADKIQFIAEGQLRFRILKWLSDTPPCRVMVEYPPEEQPADMQEPKANAIAIAIAIAIAVAVAVINTILASRC
jgi:ATP-dependent Lon protease